MHETNHLPASVIFVPLPLGMNQTTTDRTIESIDLQIDKIRKVLQSVLFHSEDRIAIKNPGIEMPTKVIHEYATQII